MNEYFQYVIEVTFGNPWLQSLALFFGTFILEEAALMAGALLAAADEMSVWHAVTVLYAGIVVSDLILYALGRASRMSPWISDGIDRYLTSDRKASLISRGSEFLHTNLFSALSTARLLPWLLIPVLVSCGVLKVGFLRFAAFTLVIAGVYTVVVFGALYIVDELLFEWLHGWAWVAGLALGGLIIGALIYGRRRIPVSSPLDIDRVEPPAQSGSSQPGSSQPGSSQSG